MKRQLALPGCEGTDTMRNTTLTPAFVLGPEAGHGMLNNGHRRVAASSRQHHRRRAIYPQRSAVPPNTTTSRSRGAWRDELRARPARC